jgi:hypothetical protein
VEQFDVIRRSNPAQWTPAMIAAVLEGSIHQLFRETIMTNKNEHPTAATNHRMKLTMQSGQEFWIEVTAQAGDGK